MTKIIRVTRCFIYHHESGRRENVCPYADGEVFLCMHEESEHLVLDIEGDIPETCPLEYLEAK